jgi:hypothetical protein
VHAQDPERRAARFVAALVLVIKPSLKRPVTSRPAGRSGLELGRLTSAIHTPAWASRQALKAPGPCDSLLRLRRRPAALCSTRACRLSCWARDEPDLGYVSVLLLPPEPAAQLAATARDRRQALQLLSPSYSANAFPFSTLHQNCNQWLAELLAFAWGGLQADEPAAARALAQRWLQTRGYVPTVFDVGWRVMMWFSELIPWIHSEDHPTEDWALQRYRVSMPASIDNFVRAAVPGTERLEFCHTPQHVVVHRGWLPIADGCQPGPGDTVVKLQ